jgi:hypothetical protein
VSRTGTSPAHRAARKKRVAEDRKIPREVLAKEFGVDVRTIGRDREAISAIVERAIGPEKLLELRKLQQLALEAIEDGLKSGLSPDTANALTRVRAEMAKLWGLNAESKAIVAHVTANQNPAEMGMFRRFVHETRWITEDNVAAWEEIWEVCRKHSKPPRLYALQLTGGEQ